MQLYYLLSSISYATIRSLFSSEIINRGKPYIKRFDIASIRYDEKKDTCNATVFGTERYRVTIARKGSNLAVKLGGTLLLKIKPQTEFIVLVSSMMLKLFDCS